jgi:ApbE superfamily uncharacterized protein (UPF0280 family)
MSAWPPPRSSLLPDGRLVLEDGPIRLVIGIEGPRAALAAAREAALAALDGLLGALSAELPVLRAPLDGPMPVLIHPVARRMAEACWPHRARFVTPMAAVAGAIAEHVRDAIAAVACVETAWVNNGGDIALHLAPGTSLRIGLVQDLGRGVAEGMAVLRAGDAVRGIATSGWPGRSFSLGVADAVTVLAADAADADAAATLIANAVDAEHGAISRVPACSLDPDSDLGELPVTVAVGRLPPALVAAALTRGFGEAERMVARGWIRAACLRCQGQEALCGEAPLLLSKLDAAVPGAA